MSILEDLVTFNYQLNQGEQLSLPLRRLTFLEWLGFDNKHPDSYKIHKTIAGLPVVLPHYHNGDIYIPEELRRSSTGKVPLNFGTYRYLDSGFYLDSITASRDGSGNKITCSISKKKHELVTNIKVHLFATHSVLESGKIESVGFGYNIEAVNSAIRGTALFRVGNDTKSIDADFFVNRNYSFGNSGRNSMNNHNFKFERSLFEGSQSSLIAYEKTINNLFERVFFQKGRFIDSSTLQNLLNLTYVSFQDSSAQAKFA
ncbi:MAG: hypothetical protein Q8R37_03330 [Nanoarchaeota archaeon]|nr:hypothetical protein [Nanoarchaeota archaeon]